VHKFSSAIPTCAVRSPTQPAISPSATTLISPALLLSPAMRPFLARSG
jgi:hypothetical protein